MNDDPDARGMPELLASSAAARIERFRSEFTLSIYFRRGPAWEAVSAFRNAWKVHPETIALHIEAEAASTPIVYPSEMATEPPPSPFDAIGHDDAADYFLFPSGLFSRRMEIEDDGEDHNLHAAWYRDLKRLHGLLVPEDCRSQAPMPEASWMTFLSLAVVYDPPPDQLIQYANSTVMMDLPPSLDPTRDLPDLETARHAMIHAPVATVRDDRALEAAWISYYEDVFSSLTQTLEQELGVDLRPLRDRLTETDPDIFARHEKRMAAIPQRLVILVDEYTSPTDVQNAYKLIRETNPPASISESRRPRNPLVCVQCAVWRDKFDWSHKQLAERFNWTLQYPLGQKPRSETARLHINEGRRIIQENSSP